MESDYGYIVGMTFLWLFNLGLVAFGFGLLFLGFIFIPILTFGDAQYTQQVS